MATHYKTASVLVNDDVIEVRGQPPYRIAELNSLYVRRVRERAARRWTLHRTGPAVVTAGASFGVALHDVLSGQGTPLLVPALTLGIGALAFLAGDRGSGTVHELWAVTGTGPVRLFRSRSRGVVAQVHSAVTEARRGCRP